MLADRRWGYFIKLMFECILIFGTCAWYQWKFKRENPNAIFWFSAALLFICLRLLIDHFLRRYFKN